MRQTANCGPLREADEVVSATVKCVSGTGLPGQLNVPRHTEIEAADQTYYLTQSRHTDTGPTSPSTAPVASGAWKGIVTGLPILSYWHNSTRKNPHDESGIRTQVCRSRGGHLATTPTRRWTDKGSGAVCSQLVLS